MALKASSSRAFAVSRGKPVACAPLRSRRSAVVKAQATHAAGGEVGRRTVLEGAALSMVLLATPGLAQAAKAPAGYVALEDRNDGYRFYYPFGWQEVTVGGADVVFKDVVEPLESVSVTMIKSDKSDITEYGSLQEVAETLAKQVLTAPGDEVQVLATSQRTDEKGRNYFELEFTAKAARFTRHQLAVVAVANGKFYTLTTGASERRWGKMKDRLQGTIKSFSILF